MNYEQVLKDNNVHVDLKINESDETINVNAIIVAGAAQPEKYWAKINKTATDEKYDNYKLSQTLLYKPIESKEYFLLTWIYCEIFKYMNKKYSLLY